MNYISDFARRAKPVAYALAGILTYGAADGIANFYNAVRGYESSVSNSGSYLLRGAEAWGSRNRTVEIKITVRERPVPVVIVQRPLIGIEKKPFTIKIPVVGRRSEKLFEHIRIEGCTPILESTQHKSVKIFKLACWR